MSPSKREVEEHEKTHLPYRDWCEHCVSGKGRADNYKRNQAEEEGEELQTAVTTYALDYMWLGENAERVEVEDGVSSSIGRPILVGADRKTKGLAANRTEKKGAGCGWIVKRVCEDIREAGYGGSRIRLKTDQEAAIKEVQSKVIEARSAETAPAHSKVGESKSNSFVEKAIGRVQGQVRTMKHALESKIGRRISIESPILDWMIGWAVSTINRFSRDKDGKTAYKRIRGR